MLPHEREMVKRLAGKPFTLLGINSDESRSALKKTLEDEHITWPNIHDGPPGEGKIANRWNIESWPMIYILDHTGKIRHRGHRLRDKELEEAVVTLLKDMAEK